MESDSGFNAMDMAVAMGHRNGSYNMITISIKWIVFKRDMTILLSSSN